MTYKLLALDLDGTVMGPDLVIPESVRLAVAGLLRRGVYVTIATGRMFAATRTYAEQLGLGGAVICYQGAMVCDLGSGEQLAHFPMPAAEAAEAAEALLEEQICMIAYQHEKLVVSGPSPELDRYLAFHPHAVEIVVEPNIPGRLAADPPTKILFVAEPGVVTRQLERLTPQFAGRLATTRSHELFGELTALGVSKGAALAALAARLGVAREEVVAIGDQENDLSMIAWAGLGLAMGNAIPEVQRAAAAVLPSVAEEGVAYAIRRYLGD
jgi:Cof subfamily protein (haloacid dehalogenase superfamily)